MAKVVALIPCAGQGKRMGASVRKPYLEVHGRPLLTYTLDVFQKHPLIDGIVLVVESDAVKYCNEEIVYKYGYTKVQSVVAGGEERQDSVLCGLACLAEDTGWIVVHDGARPLIKEETITKALQTAFEKGAVVVGVRVKDTIKVVSSDFSICKTPERQTLWQIQTPQIFRRHIMVQAYEKAVSEGWTGTDDASFVERFGEKVYIVEGEYSNIKVTTPDDLIYLNAMLKVEDYAYRFRL
ncbi:MAG: 2-C-methyl-D-erythritol 4-phosphate cytidylyltransferase [Firmicutes bacterium HGW-Firmicutes-12]|nr:MAG: 2-C-methyl-D-erythritol 4-phosphate cytidylyltransferase [Firmicutes bacterium HGW-Firmicutes-12]